MDIETHILSFRKIEKYDLALQDYTSALKIDPNHFKAYYNRGFCPEKVGDYRKAEKDYQRALV